MTKATIIPSLTNNPPSRANPAAFPTDGDSFLNDLPDLVSGVNTVATELNTWNSDISELQYSAGLSATNASNSKDTSLGNARLAASWFLSEWVSGTTYPAGQIVYSNVDGREYKRITAGAGTTDPSSDTTNWEPLGWEYITNYPDIRPTLDLNFAGSQTVDPRITFTRNSTATYFDKFGVMQTAGINQPRIDFDPVTGECKGLLIEEQRTNLLTYSEQFDNAAWIKNNALVISNTAISPLGDVTADKFVESNNSAFHVFYRSDNISLVSGNSYTFSVYVKAAERSGVRLISFDLTTDKVTIFNLSTASVFASDATSPAITSIGNGWYRISHTFTATASGSTQYASQVSLRNLAGDDLYQGDGFSGIYIWGAQLEAGAFPTSYIPTTTAPVTRAADNASMTGANFTSWYRQDEGTLFVEALDPVLPTVSRAIVEVNDGTEANRFSIESRSQDADMVGFVGISKSGIAINIQAAGLGDGRVKTAFALGPLLSGGVIGCADGNFTPSVADPIIPMPLSSLRIGANAIGVAVWNGTIKRITYWPKRLSNQVLQAITQP